MANLTPKIVVIGGGTGTFTVLSALKNYASEITAIVNMIDDGGSTGILRDELGVLPPGDVRQCLVALSRSSDTMRELFNYRFGEGTFQGHAFGNLFLTALEKTTGSFAHAVATAGDVLDIVGRVVPVTLTDSHLVLTQDDGSEVVGEFDISSRVFTSTEPPRLSLIPAAALNPVAREAIMDADIVVIAPGNLYGSLVPALIVDGMPQALQETNAKIVYITNLVTKPGQTDGFKVHDYVREIERFVGRGVLDNVFYNRHKPNPKLLERYAKDGEYWVESDQSVFETATYDATGVNLVADQIHVQNPNDKMIERTLIRHDSDRVARLIMRLYFS